MKKYDVLIVGSGHGGAQTAIGLRKQGFRGSIGLLDRSRALPYERPPLSKEYLFGEKTFERILIRPKKFWQDKDIHLLGGSNVSSLDPLAKTISCGNGQEYAYEQLVWSAGGDAKRLICDGSDLRGVHTVRSKEDVDALIDDMKAGTERCTIIGGGYIGLEAAAAFRKLGHEVVLVEALNRVLSRVTGPEVSRFIKNEHVRREVKMHLKSGVRCIEGDGGLLTGVVLETGEVIQTDIVLVGIGIEPCIDALAKAGAETTNGVVVDEYCQTTLPGVYAIGDCAAHINPFANGQRIRLESVQNANDMASVVASVICGNFEPYHATPWFWSDQYDLKIQTVGLSAGYDDSVTRGDPSNRSFSIVYLKNGKVVALDCVNSMKDYVQGRRLVETGLVVARKDLADTSRQLKELL